MKQTVKILALLLALCMLPAMASAELELRPVFEYMPSISSVTGSKYIILGDKSTGLKGVYTTDGQEVLACAYSNLSSVGNNFFIELKDKENVNSNAIICLDGRKISDYAYGRVVTFNRHWAAGYVLAEATEEQYDLKISKAFYWIDRCDLFYVDDEVKDSYLVGSIGDRQFVKADVHGKFIAVQGRDEAITVYDREFNPLDIAIDSVSTDIYSIQDYAVMEPGTGKKVIENYISVAEADTPDGLLLLASRYHWTGKLVTSVFDDEGALLYDTEMEITYANRDYAVFRQNKKYGLYDLRAQRVLVPAEYGKIVTGDTAVDAYVFNGYVMVETDKLRGFVDTRTGEVSCELKYNYKEFKRAGCVMYRTEEDGRILLVAADGTESHPDVDSISASRGSGALLVAKKGDYYGLIDWHGEEVLPFIHNKAIVITDDSFGIIRTSTGVELDEIL